MNLFFIIYSKHDGQQEQGTSVYFLYFIFNSLTCKNFVLQKTHTYIQRYIKDKNQKKKTPIRLLRVTLFYKLTNRARMLVWLSISFNLSPFFFSFVFRVVFAGSVYIIYIIIYRRNWKNTTNNILLSLYDECRYKNKTFIRFIILVLS